MFYLHIKDIGYICRTSSNNIGLYKKEITMEEINSILKDIIITTENDYNGKIYTVYLHGLGHLYFNSIRNIDYSSAKKYVNEIELYTIKNSIKIIPVEIKRITMFDILNETKTIGF